MQIQENKYHSTVKLEFRDLVENMVNRGRTVFHMYTIHRLLSLGLLIDFTYEYTPNVKEDPYVEMEINLQEFGVARFKINTQSNYGSVADDLSMQVLKGFLLNFDTGLDEKGAQAL